MNKAILIHPLGNLIFNPETGWSGDVERLVESLNRNYPPGFTPASLYSYQPDGELIPAYAAAELHGASVIVIRDEPPTDELVGNSPEDEEMVERGGPGSGHRGHKGRPGKRGGSRPDPGGHVEPPPEPEKPKPPAPAPKAHGEPFDYKRRLPRPKQWVWGDYWMDRTRAKEDGPEFWRLDFMTREGKKKMRKEFGALARDYFNHPDDQQWKDGDWFRFFREDLEGRSDSSYMYWSARDLIPTGDSFNGAWTTVDEVKDAVADMYAAEFAAYYKKELKSRTQRAEVGDKQKEWAQSTTFLSPKDGFFFIPETERWDGAREGVQALADSGLLLPESFKAQFGKPKPDGSLPFVETKAGSKWGHYMNMGPLALNIASTSTTSGSLRTYRPRRFTKSDT